MRARLTRWLTAAGLTLALASPAAAQDVLARARTAPTRGDGIALLAAHLSTTPRDVDARLLYALMLSWDGRYDEARHEFQRVLEQAPGYTDARVGLMNVEWWSGRRAAAREQVDLILAHDPGHPRARLVRQRLDADKPWQTRTSIGFERFSDGRATWQEQQFSLSRQTAAGSVIARVSHAERFARTDEQYEVEFYPAIRPGTYGFVSVGVAPEHELYPRRRLAFDLYQSLGHGFEVSGGYRRLNFIEATSIYVGSVTKYVGNWMVTGKIHHVPAQGSFESTSGHAFVRRYFGADGGSFAGLGYSHGLSREEVRGLGDLVDLDSQTVRGQVDTKISGRLRLQVDASTSRIGRMSGRSLWQTALSTGFSVDF